MKKSVKVISTLLLAVMIVMSIASVVFAVDVDSVISGVETGGTTTDTSKITTLGANIVNIIQVVGIVISIIVLLVIGIKYIIGSAEQKAEYKKTMIPYIVGALLIFAASTIVNILYGVISGAASSTSA